MFLGAVPCASIIIGTTVTFTFQNIFSSQVRFKYLAPFLFSLILTLRSSETAKFTIQQVFFSFLLLNIIRCCLLVRIIIISCSQQLYLMVLCWSLKDSESPLVSRTLLIILGDFIYAVVQMISVRPPISNFSSPVWEIQDMLQVHQIQLVTFMLQSFFFSSLAKSEYFSFFEFYSVVHQDGEIHNTIGFLFW